MDERTGALAKKNDEFRTTPSSPLGEIVIDEGVHQLGSQFVSDVMRKVRSFDGFGDDEDDEHACGEVVVDDIVVVFWIDYLDRKTAEPADDPLNLSKTLRRMTIARKDELG